jgi:hypothetical protein
MKKNKILLAVILLPCIVVAQNYWQQEVNYKINVSLDDVKHELNADASIEYTNNSPNELSFIYFHLWPNAYRDNTTALAKQLRDNNETELWYAKKNERGYIDGLDFKVNSEKVKIEFDAANIDICKLILNAPLKTGERITITTPFHVKIPIGVFSRLGHIGQQYQITQWYPKPAVYDANGWNQMPYLDQGEFYSEFGSFDVSITLPKNYVLMATGDMVNGESEYAWLDEKVNQTKGADLENIKNKRDEKGNDIFPESDKELKTLRFKQSNVHDFAWFCDKRYLVLNGEVELPNTKHKVKTYCMFTPDYAKAWKNSIEYINDALFFYSKWNGDYPYNYCTAVDGSLSAGGGMEYPNITVIGATTDKFTLETVIMHEVGHNWFYGMLGSNERLHPWMDEGINSANENRYIRTKYPNEGLFDGVPDFVGLSEYKHKAQYELAYMLNCKRNLDQPCELPAADYLVLNYAGIVYSKTAIVFDYLRAYLGDTLYDKCMMNYFNEWHFKHPQPKDMRKIVEEVSGKNFSWLFDDLINTTKQLDYKILSFVDHRQFYKPPSNTISIKVKNTGEIAGPYVINLVKDGKIISQQWFDGIAPSETKTVTITAMDADLVCIDYNGEMPEVNRNNNRLKTHGLCKKTEPIKFQFLGSLDSPAKSQFFLSPVLGWNKYNKAMVGVALYNNIIPEKKLEYLLMPMYAFGNKTLSGHAAVYFNMYFDKIFRAVQLSVKGNRYAFGKYESEDALNFNKLSAQLKFDIKKKKARSDINQTVFLKSTFIVRNYFDLKTEFSPFVYVPKTDTLNFNEISYVLNNTRTLHPFTIGVNMQQSKDFTKLALDATYRITLKGKNKFVQFRLFAGTFVGNQTADAKRYAFRMSGFTGADDYMYDNIFLGRTENEGILSQQFSENNGAFKVYSSIGASNKWITALNIKASIPKVPVVRLYADVGAAAYDGVAANNVIYNAGAYISMGKGFFEVFVPLLMSSEIEEYNSNNDINFVQRIRFTLNFNMANPFELIRNFQM